MPPAAQLAFGPLPTSRTDAAERSFDWSETDVERAIRAAGEAGLRAYRVEIAPDATISIVVGERAEQARAEIWDDLLNP